VFWGLGRGEGFESAEEGLQEQFVKLEKTQRLAESTVRVCEFPVVVILRSNLHTI
jgi:hypothetical protein